MRMSKKNVSLMNRLIYKMLMRSCVFNDIKHDKKVLLCVTVLDFCKFFGRVFICLGAIATRH
jgi:hypothetical protein